MTARELFSMLAPLVGPALEEQFHRRDLCILATRVALEVAAHFGIQAEAAPVKVMAYNALFARHVAAQDVDFSQPCASWGDDSWAVGIGFGGPRDATRWNGHLIVIAADCFADFSIQQAERLERGIQTGPALVGPYTGVVAWQAVEQASGTVIDYHLTGDDSWRKARDWRHEARRRPIVGKLIRAVRELEVECPR